MHGESLPAYDPQQLFGDASALIATLLSNSKLPVDIIAVGALMNIATMLRANQG